MGAKSAGPGGMPMQQGDVPAFDMPPMQQPMPPQQPQYASGNPGGSPPPTMNAGPRPGMPIFSGDGSSRPFPGTNMPPMNFGGNRQPMPFGGMSQQPMPAYTPMPQQPMPFGGMQRPIPFAPPVAQQPANKMPFQADLMPRPPITNQGPGSGLAPARGIGGGMSPEVLNALRLAIMGQNSPRTQQTMDSSPAGMNQRSLPTYQPFNPLARRG